MAVFMAYRLGHVAGYATAVGMYPVGRPLFNRVMAAGAEREGPLGRNDQVRGLAAAVGIVAGHAGQPALLGGAAAQCAG